MSTEPQISTSIVIYNEDPLLLKKRLNVVFDAKLNLHIYLIDNSPYPTADYFNFHKKLTYIFNGANLGYGRGHNLILHEITSDYHLVLNPDVDFDPNILTDLVLQLQNDEHIGVITPKVYYPDGSLQYLCRKHPSFLDLANRLLTFSKSRTMNSEYRNLDLGNETFNPEFVHGCFMLFRTQIFKNLNGFDESFFLYLEDADICKRVWESGFKIQYHPKVSIVHQHRRASKKNIFLFFTHIRSSFRYFFKWGF